MFANTNIHGYFQRFLLNILPLLLICNPYFGVPSPRLHSNLQSFTENIRSNQTPYPRK